jgi:histidinol-phosphate aminotransferase
MHPEVVGWLNRVRGAFNVNLLAQAAGVAALRDQAYLEQSRRLNQEGYAQLTQGLVQRGLVLIPSFANFFCLEVSDAKQVYQGLLHQGVIVRPMHSYGLPNHLRVTVGSHSENQRFLDALDLVLR